MSEAETDAGILSCPACGTRVDASKAEPLARVACPQCGEKLRVERSFDNFLLLETLGTGGMGTVYKARDTQLDRLVALKLIRSEAESAADPTLQLQHEARVTASINHPHVVKVYSLGNDHGQRYVVMELVDHGSLDDLIAQLKRIPEERVLDIGIQIANGLAAAQEKGLIHRDIKPANILFSDEQTAKIVDFGLAGAADQKTETKGEIWGTPYYVAPENLNNEPEDFRSDIYSLGATLFQALAGRPPIEGETNSASALRELKNQPLVLAEVAPDISDETSRTIMRMLAPNPAQRFGSYQELIKALQRAKQALHPSSEQVTSISRRRWPAILALIVFLVAAGTVAFFWWQKNGDRSAAVVPAETSQLEKPAPLEHPEAAAQQESPAGQMKEKQMASEVAAREKAENEMKERQRRELMEKESPGWKAMLAAYRQKVGAYDFAGARDAIAKAQFSEPSLKESQENLAKKAQWLVDWKTHFIEDLNRVRFTGAISDVTGMQYTGIKHASEARLNLMMPHGSTELNWTKFSPATLLAIANWLIAKVPAAEAADREWLSAVFANETGQPEPARFLANAAAKAKPEYGAYLPLIIPEAGNKAP